MEAKKRALAKQKQESKRWVMAGHHGTNNCSRCDRAKDSTATQSHRRGRQSRQGHHQITCRAKDSQCLCDKLLVFGTCDQVAGHPSREPYLRLRDPSVSDYQFAGRPNRITANSNPPSRSTRSDSHLPRLLGQLHGSLPRAYLQGYPWTRVCRRTTGRHERDGFQRTPAACCCIIMAREFRERSTDQHQAQRAKEGMCDVVGVSDLGRDRWRRSG
ncbi:hypothetical protein HDK64DRAFT_49329 [Phyllosticta capitalensis]